MKQISLTNNSHFKFLAYTTVIGIWVFSTSYTLGQSVQESITRYNTSEGFLRFIQVALALPTLFIYLAVTFAAVTFAVYVQRIRTSKEERGYNYIATGLMLTLLSFMASTLIGLFQYKFKTGEGLSNYIIIRNYVLIAINLGVYYSFWQGSKHLISTLKSKAGLASRTRMSNIIVLAFSALYAFLVFQNPYRTTSDNALVRPTFALPDALIVTTVILPYVITWLMAGMSVVNLAFYAKQVNGIIFKSLFRDLARGFLLIIGLTISLQIIGQFAEFWSHAGLNSILLLIAVIFIALIIAYTQFGLAARKLDKIETV